MNKKRITDRTIKMLSDVGLTSKSLLAQGYSKDLQRLNL
jgi:hypothetical protein